MVVVNDSASSVVGGAGAPSPDEQQVTYPK
jgi:hypothetical protein